MPSFRNTYQKARKPKGSEPVSAERSHCRMKGMIGLKKRVQRTKGASSRRTLAAMKRAGPFRPYEGRASRPEMKKSTGISTTSKKRMKCKAHGIVFESITYHQGQIML